MPFTIRFYREYIETREQLKIESIVDKYGGIVSKNLFKLQLQTLDEDNGSWLDSGAFVLKVNPRQNNQLKKMK